jgi:hypothetical protein
MEGKSIMNPLSEGAPIATTPQQSKALVEVETGRAVADVQAMVLSAKRWPRDTIAATDRILNECQRPGLASEAIYSYARGGTEIQGPSIRLAEVLARNWGNIDTGIQELARSGGQSEMRAYCVDLESNYRAHFDFVVVHERTTKKGTYQLTDGRDIYETVANQASRRLRAMILKVIPSDVVDAAVSQCEATLAAKADTSPEALKKLLDVFAAYKVTKEQIEKRIQRRLDTITPAQLIQLRKVYNSLKDGMSGPADWFEMPAEQVVDASASLKEKIKSTAGGTGKKTGDKQVETSADLPLSNEMSLSACPNSGAGDKMPKMVCDACQSREGCPAWEV